MLTIEPIGIVRSMLASRDSAPLQGNEGAPEAWLELTAAFAPGLVGITAGDAIDGTPIVDIKRVLWVKARPDYEPLFSILDGMRQDPDRRFWIERLEAPEDNRDIEEDTGQMSTGVKIVLQMSHNILTRAEEYGK